MRRYAVSGIFTPEGMFLTVGQNAGSDKARRGSIEGNKIFICHKCGLVRGREKPSPTREGPRGEERAYSAM